jgi:8-oxo-dGTP pyrophosphatase MutT (NUDIX family)
MNRHRSVVDVYVLLRRPDGRILLGERANTGYADGQLRPPSGHLKDGESVIDCAVREAKEEAGITIDPQDVAFTHVVHHRNPAGEGPHWNVLHRGALAWRANQPRTAQMRRPAVGGPARPTIANRALHRRRVGLDQRRRTILGRW